MKRRTNAKSPTADETGYSQGPLERASAAGITQVARSREAEDRRTPDKAVSRFERWLLGYVLESVGNPAVGIVLWNGEEFAVSAAATTMRLVIRDRAALRLLLVDPLFQFAELYCAGRLDIDGDLVQLLMNINSAMAKTDATGFFLPRLASRLHRRSPSSAAASRENIHRHYDIGNDFYKLWLDKQLLYTCAYFPDKSCSLEQAQIAKMDYVCRKLWLKPGETVIEAGCGWGALALHMAQHFGVKVRACNISHSQILYARERAAAQGLADQVEFVEEDWRKISGQYDVFVSVGMLEHVGLKNYRRLGDVIERCLKPQGRGLIHSIAMNEQRRLDAWTERRIFPGAQPPALSRMTRIFEPHGFSILDVENLRLHYAQTLRHWLSRFEQATDDVRAMFDERFVRMWRLYLAASVASFETGWLQLLQVVFARGTNNEIPWTREYLYNGHESLRCSHHPGGHCEEPRGDT